MVELNDNSLSNSNKYESKAQKKYQRKYSELIKSKDKKLLAKRPRKIEEISISDESEFYEGGCNELSFEP